MSGAPPHLAILASAGTGKTYALTSRYLRLIAAGEQPERILATTFTRKAAGEILRKIVSRLADGAESPKALRELGDSIDLPGLRSADCVRLLGAMAQSLDRLAIGTLDSFFARLAAGFSLALGAGDWRMLDEDEDADLRAEAVTRVLHTGDRDDLMDLVRRRNPGMADRSVHADILDAVGQAYREFQRTNAEAWGRLEVAPGLETKAFARALQELGALPVAKTKTGTENLKWKEAHVKALRAATGGDWEGFIATGIAGKVIAGEGSFNRAPIDAATRDAYQSLIDHAASVLLGPLPERARATRRMLERFDHAYRALKQDRSVCTFDDVPRLLLESGAAASLTDMYYRLDARIGHVLLDEFQDTSVAQWRLLEPLVEEIVAQGDDRSFLCVGDVKQSLYSWRNAEPELLPSIPRRWEQVAREELVDSWRSSQIVIDAVNLVMGTLAANPVFAPDRAADGDRGAVEHWGAMFSPHRTKRAYPGFCRLQVSRDKTEQGTLQDGALRAAADRIAELRAADPLSSIGVLFRGKKLIAPMKLELAQRGIMASEEGGNPLTDSAPVAAALSMLLLADHPGSTAALFHVATSPLGPAVGVSYPGTHEGVCRAAQRTRLRLLADGFAAVLEDWFRAIAPQRSARDARRFDQLVSLAAHFDERTRLEPTTRPSAFVAFVERRRVEDPSAAPVRLMTIHASKGLEFHTVVLPWLEDRVAGKPPAVLEDRPDDPLAPADLVTLCPKKDLVALHPVLRRLHARWREGEVLEELCALYVALTRAIHSIEMFVAPHAKGLAEDDATSLSFARILRGALEPGPAVAGETLWSNGDESWRRQRRAAPAAAQPAAGPVPPPAIRLDLDAGARARHVPRRAPTGAAHAAQARGDWPGLDDLAGDTARARGVLVHAWLEAIEWLEDGEPAEALLQQLASRLDLPVVLDVGTLAAEFRAMLRREPLRRLLSRAAYSPGAGQTIDVRRELPFALLDRSGAGPELRVGRIDRLVVIRGRPSRVLRAEVIDFKTDVLADPSPASLATHATAYGGQMQEYRAAAARLLRCDAGLVEARLVFVSHDEVVPA